MAKQKIAIYYGDKLNSGQYDNGVWMDILKIPFLSHVAQAEDYDVIIRTLWVESTVQGWSQEIRRRYPHVKQIGLSDHPLSTHISKLPPDQQVRYLQDLQALDGIMALTEEERQWYSIAAPSIPVIKAGLPFPFEAYQKKYGGFQGSEKRFIGLGVGASDNDRNFISSFLVFKRLQIDYPEIEGVFLSIPDFLIGQCVIFADNANNVYIQQREDMKEFYDTLSQCHFVINMADRNTPGRIQGEGAFFGVPVIGSNRLELQNELFPSLSVSPYNVEKAYQLAKYLYENPGNRDTLSAYAQDKLQKYDYDSSKRKFNKLLKEINNRG